MSAVMTAQDVPAPPTGGDPPADAAVRTAVNRLVKSRTGSMLKNLRVDVAAAPPRGGYTVRLSGSCGSYYGKQLAGVAAMAAAPGGTVSNEIAVR